MKPRLQMNWKGEWGEQTQPGVVGCRLIWGQWVQSVLEGRQQRTPGSVVRAPEGSRVYAQLCTNCRVLIYSEHSSDFYIYLKCFCFG